MSGSLATRMMSPRRLARYASMAFAVEVERWRRFVTPSEVRSLRVLFVDTTLTKAIGATPTITSAARTFCQNRIRGRRIRSPASRALFVHLRARVRASSAPRETGPSHRVARARTGKVLVPPCPPGPTIPSNNTRKTVPRTWRTSGQRNDQDARRRQGLRQHPNRGRVRHLFPPVAGGRRRVRYPP